ncbi:MAG: hypothetical protein EPN89_13040 [Methylovulum sp.]|nr:MAG: hypothetical protein EPN89_13040 [Methylovulum sp.]
MQQLLGFFQLSGTGYVHHARQLKEKYIIPAGMPEPLDREANPEAREGKSCKHIHVFWMSAIPADITAYPHL